MHKICHLQITDIDFMPRVWREAVSAKESGYAVCIIGYGESTERYGIEYKGFDPYDSRIKNFLFLTRKMVNESIKTGSEVIQVHSPIFLLYARELKRKGIIVIFDSHENYPVQILGKKYIPRPFRKTVSLLYYMYEGRTCRRIDAVLYPCTFDGKNIFDGRSKCSLKVENYSQYVKVESTKRESRAIYAGAITESRGAKTMIEACVQADCPLLLCGAVSNAELRNFLLSYEGSEISFLGMKSREELFELYVSSGIGLCLLKPDGQYAHCDNMSTKIYEYMQCGLPIVFSDFPYAKSQNEKYHFGIAVNPNNVNEIVDAIKYLLNNPQEAFRMGENGRKAVKEEYNWTIQGEKLTDLYAKLLS